MLLVVTKDSDFNELVARQERSPGLVWIRTGNCSTRGVEELIRNHRQQIIDISETDSVGLLMLF
jgi:predicted nuclease of predicted toxin-antitoxin system